MKNNQGLMTIAVFATVGFCFLNELRFALITLVLAYWFINEERTTSQILQPIMIWLSARIFATILSWLTSGISDLIRAFTGSWNSFSSDVMKFVNPICTLWLVIFLCLFVGFYVFKKQVPIYGKWGDFAAKYLHKFRDKITGQPEVNEE